MKGLLFTCLVGLCFRTIPLIGGEKELILTLENGVTWESVFDAGFRPAHERYGMSSCFQRNVTLGIRQHDGGEILHLGQGDIKFTLRANHLLSLVMFYGRENKTVKKSTSQTEIFSDIFGKSIKRKSIIRSFKNGNIDNRDSSSAARVGDLSIIHSFSHSHDAARPLVERLSIALKSDEAKRPNWLISPIEPPEGYEHISLEPVLDEPDTASDGEGEAVVEDRKVPQANKPPEPPDSAREPERRGLSWWIWLIAAAALGGIAWVMLRARLRSGT